MTLDRSREAVRARQEEALRLRESGLTYTAIAAQLGYTVDGRVFGSAARNAVMQALARRAKNGGVLRPFGVEIETVGLTKTELAAAIQAVVNHHVPTFGYHGKRCECCGRQYTAEEKLTIWKVESDGSLRHQGSTYRTGEVVSPILRGEEGLDEMTRVVNALYNAGARPNRSTGLHVHVEASDLSGEEVARVVEFYTTNQARIDQLVSISRRNSRWARKYPAYRVESMKQDAANGKDALRAYASKYSVVNLSPLFSYGTIEFRQHQGTTSAKKVAAWVRFVQGVIAAAQAAVEIDTAVEVEGMLDAMVEKSVLDADAARLLKSAPARFRR